MDHELSTQQPNSTPSKMVGVKALLTQSWNEYKTHFNTLVPILLVGAIPMYIQWLLLFLSPGHEVGARIGNVGHNGIYGGALFVPFMILTIAYVLGLIWASAALIHRIEKLSEPMTTVEAFSKTKKNFWPFLLTAFLSALFTTIGFILVIIPGVIIAVWLVFTSYIVIIEHKKYLPALQASKEYVSGYWWPVFGRLVVVALIAGLASLIIGAVFSALVGKDVGRLLSNLVGLILAPWLVLYEYHMYINLRKIRSF